MIRLFTLGLIACIPTVAFGQVPERLIPSDKQILSQLPPKSSASVPMTFSVGRDDITIVKQLQGGIWHCTVYCEETLTFLGIKIGTVKSKHLVSIGSKP